MGESEKKRPFESIPSTENRIQLLLHCVDGCVPYLNPHQLEQHFPPSETDLWLGLAVRDSCVAPIFDRSSTSEKTKGGGNARIVKQKQSDSTKNKVRGYTFVATSPDPWLLPYTRMTVPSFGLRKIDKTKNSSKASSCGNKSRNTDISVHVWTPHGRQKLTTELYATSSLEGLKSQHTLSLYDDVDEEEYSKRRKQKAKIRNLKWFQHLSSSQDSLFCEEQSTKCCKNITVARGRGNNGSLLWKPILLPDDIEEEEDPNLNDESKNSSLSSDVNMGKNAQHVPFGVAFVGRWRPGLPLNKMIYEDINVNNYIELIKWKAVLTTYSLSEILEIASSGLVNVIGTNLPQKWAKEKLALGLDLSTELLHDSPVSKQDQKRQKIKAIETAAGLKVNIKTADKNLLDADGCMDLSDKIYTRDPKSLCAGCKCFVCKENRFSRAYIHHLVVAKEMLAEILIFGHNLHCLLKLLRFFASEQSNRVKVSDSIRCQIRS